MKTRILNRCTGTATINRTAYSAQWDLYRSRPLTPKGAQRILRRENLTKSIAVDAVQTFIDQR